MNKVALTYKKIGMIEEAIRCFKKVLQRDKKDVEAIIHIGIINI
jgi:hypothetical protein